MARAVLLIACAGAIAVAAWLIARDGGDGDAKATAERPAAAQAPAPEGGRPARPLALDTPRGAHPIVWVRRGEQVEVRAEPGGSEIVETVGKRTEFSSPTVFGVQKQAGEWAGVTTPALPNNRLGWVRLDARKLKAGWVDDEIVVDLSERRAELRDEGRLVRSFAVTVGAPGAETPTGRFAVTDTFRGDLNAAYGCCALALTANQPHLPSEIGRAHV